MKIMVRDYDEVMEQDEPGETVFEGDDCVAIDFYYEGYKVTINPMQFVYKVLSHPTIYKTIAEVTKE